VREGVFNQCFRKAQAACVGQLPTGGDNAIDAARDGVGEPDVGQHVERRPVEVFQLGIRERGEAATLEPRPDGALVVLQRRGALGVFGGAGIAATAGAGLGHGKCSFRLTPLLLEKTFRAAAHRC